jgi:AbrB family looped-hinge helix DNA binding protein
MTSKGQVTIPVAIRRRLGLKQGQRIMFVEEDGQVRIAPATSVAESTAGIFKSYARRPPMSIREEKIAIEEAIAEEAASEGL